LNPSWPWLCGARRGDAATSEGPLREEGRGGEGEEWTFGCEESDKDGKDFGAMDVALVCLLGCDRSKGEGDGVLLNGFGKRIWCFD